MGEAGQSSQTSQPPLLASRSNPIIGIIGLIIGIVGLFIYPLPCGIVAIVLGISSYMREKTAIAWLVLILGLVDIGTGLYFIITLS